MVHCECCTGSIVLLFTSLPNFSSTAGLRAAGTVAVSRWILTLTPVISPKSFLNRSKNLVSKASSSALCSFEVSCLTSPQSS